MPLPMQLTIFVDTIKFNGLTLEKFLYVPFHVEFLKSELARRQSKNPRYSLRAFALHLEIHPSALSRILAGKLDLSLTSSVMIVKVVTFSDTDKVKFLVSVAEERMYRAATFLNTKCNVVLPISRNKTPISPITGKKRA